MRARPPAPSARGDCSCCSAWAVTLTSRACACAAVSRASSQLVAESKRFSVGARKLNLLEMYKKYGPWVAFVAIILFVLYFKFFY